MGSPVKPLRRTPHLRAAPTDVEGTQLPQARSLPERPSYHITGAIGGAAGAVGVAAGGELIGLSASASTVTAGSIAIASFGGAVAAARVHRRRTQLDQFVERTYNHLGATAPSRRMVSKVRWSRGWPGVPLRMRIHFTSAARLNDEEWEQDLLTLIESQPWAGNYRIARIKPNRHWIEVLRALPAPEPEPESEQIQDARRKVETLIGPTCHISEILTDPGTGDVTRIAGTHEISTKLEPSGYRARLQRTVSATLPGRWRAHFDLEANTFVFEQRPTFPPLLHIPVDDVIAARPPMPAPGQPDQSVLDNYAKVEIPYADDEDGHPMVWRPSINPHFLLTGKTGTGKTSTSHNLLNYITNYGWPVWIIDGKGTAFLGYRDWPNVQVVASTTAHHVAALHQIKQLMEFRYEQVISGRATDSDFAPLFVIIDEWADMRIDIINWYASVKGKGMPAKPPVLDAVPSVARKGREGRVHVLLQTQRPDVELLGSGEMRENFAQRMSMGPLGPKAAEMTWESPMIGTSIPRGIRGRGTTVDGNDRIVEAQSYYTPDPRKTAPGTPDAALLDLLRPTDVRHERLLIADPVVTADLDSDAEPELSYYDYLNAPWHPAADYPELDPLLRSTEHHDPTVFASPTALFERDRGFRRAPREEITVRTTKQDAEAIPSAAEPAAVSAEAAAERGRDLLAATGRRHLHVVTGNAPDTPPWDIDDIDDSADLDADDWEGYSREALDISPWDVEVGDLLLVDEAGGEWGVVDAEPGEDVVDPELVSIPWRSVDDEDAELQIHPSIGVRVRKPTE